MRRALLCWAAGLLSGVALLLAAPVQATHDHDPAAPPTVTGCVIRFYSTGPAIHENSAHQCTGANAVAVNPAGDLLITSDWHGPVVSIAVSPDESLTRRGILAGASDGLGQTVIKFYDADTGQAVRADASALACQWCNLWVTWVHAG